MCWSTAILNKPSKQSTSSIIMKAKILKCINICKNFCKENLCLYILKVFMYNCILLQQYILCASSSWQATSTSYASPSYLSHHIIPSQKSPVPETVYKVEVGGKLISNTLLLNAGQVQYYSESCHFPLANNNPINLSNSYFIHWLVVIRWILAAWCYM
jgi:hypothetical protein